MKINENDTRYARYLITLLRADIDAIEKDLREGRMSRPKVATLKADALLLLDMSEHVRDRYLKGLRDRTKH